MMFRKWLPLIIILSLIGGGVVLNLFHQPLLRIKTVSCKLETKPCPDTLNQKIQEFVGQSFFFAPIQPVIEAWQLELYQLQTFSKTWPQKIELNFTSEPDFYRLQLETNHYLITKTGLIKQKLDANQPPKANELPIVILTQPAAEVIKGQQVTPQFHQVFKLVLTQLEAHQLEIQTLKLIGSDLIKLQLNSKLRAIVEPTHSQTQLAKLALIIQELDLAQIDLAIKEIDLRFELPVLRTQLSL